MILICLLIGGIAGWIVFSRNGESSLLGALIGAVGGLLGVLFVWVLLSIVGLLVGIAAAVAGAVALLWLYRRFRDG